MACRVAVRIMKTKDGFLVKGRKTSVLCDTFKEAWGSEHPLLRMQEMVGWSWLRVSKRNFSGCRTILPS